MTTPTLDIIVPVWNQPFETRACLVSILAATDSARLIIVNNGCNRDTELLLEEFCDPLGDRVLYMSMERNIGFVPAINRALARSTADWAMVIRPNGIVADTCLQTLLPLTGHDRAGIVSPLCTTETPLSPYVARASCSHLETDVISFAGLLLSRVMREEIGLFDEELDGGQWCLRDYQQRAAAHHYRTLYAPAAIIQSGPSLRLGSEERRREREAASRELCRQLWGLPRSYAVYFPKQTEITHLDEALNTILAAARLGDRFTLFLHHLQYRQAAALGYRCLHTAIELVSLARLTPHRDLRIRLRSLPAGDLGLTVIKGVDGIPVPGHDQAQPFTAVHQRITEVSTCRT